MRLHPRIASGIFGIICFIIAIIVDTIFKINIMNNFFIVIIACLSVVFYYIYEKYFYDGD